MSPHDLKAALAEAPFTPMEIVLSSGDRYRVEHPEFARITRTGAVYVFSPDPVESSATAPVFSSPSVLSISQIVAIEKARQSAA